MLIEGQWGLNKLVDFLWDITHNSDLVVTRSDKKQTHLHALINACLHTYACTVCLLACTHMYMHTHTGAHIHTHAHMYTSMPHMKHMHAHTHARTHACMHAHARTHTQTHTHTHTHTEEILPTFQRDL